jgi:hypothetical protein
MFLDLIIIAAWLAIQLGRGILVNRIKTHQNIGITWPST